jgi:hypothetical protein
MRRDSPRADAFGRFAFGWSRFGSFSAPGCDIGLVDPFGFSWLVAVSLRRPPIMRVGFPWISSSESRLINGLRGIKREQFLSALSVPLAAPKGGWARGSLPAERQNCSWGELNQISDSL